MGARCPPWDGWDGSSTYIPLKIHLPRGHDPVVEDEELEVRVEPPERDEGGQELDPGHLEHLDCLRPERMGGGRARDEWYER